MKKYSCRNSSIRNIARLIIRYEDKILLCRSVGKDYYFHPGGHIEDVEALVDAITREINEELGLCINNKLSYVGTFENIFQLSDSTNQHEICNIFSTEVKEKTDFISKESHLEFRLVKLSELEKISILPQGLKQEIASWLRTNRSFFLHI